ncbi:hypothetical protein COT47_00800 [Candidatus Woesearchaeota archaeon CG08_land_8_20_14_0_20_43_7]|nr:MAG: hypothetical protein COT47_00800 [Candidatus Woesearchaeota archaeon CG08_land_8_20_14_0_20_43_7]
MNDDTGNLRYETGGFDTNNFTVTYHVNGTEHRTGFLVRGDLVQLNLQPPRDLVSDESVRITFIPKIGTQSVVEFRTPSVMSRQNVILFP